MSLVTFHCNSGANIHSCRTEKVDTVKTLGLDEGEWEALSEDERYQLVEEWAWKRLEVYWTEES
jgi:hypothetical protein